MNNNDERIHEAMSQVFSAGFKAQAMGDPDKALGMVFKIGNINPRIRNNSHEDALKKHVMEFLKDMPMPGNNEIVEAFGETWGIRCILIDRIVKTQEGWVEVQDLRIKLGNELVRNLMVEILAENPEFLSHMKCGDDLLGRVVDLNNRAIQFIKNPSDAVTGRVQSQRPEVEMTKFAIEAMKPKTGASMPTAKLPGKNMC